MNSIDSSAATIVDKCDQIADLIKRKTIRIDQEQIEEGRLPSIKRTF